jgi:hypothetical protein
MNHHKEDPGEAEEKSQAIEDKDRGEGGSFDLLRWSIEPEELRENNKRNRAIAGVK